jgi:O-antigen ligase
MQEILSQKPQSSLALVLLTGIAAAAIAVYSPLIAIAVIGAVGGALAVGLSRTLVVAVIVVSGTADFMARFNAGPVSTMGMITVLYSIGVWSVWLIRTRSTPNRVLMLVPFLLFAAWGMMSLVFWYVPSINSAQNVLVIVAFLGLIFLCSRDMVAGDVSEQEIGKAFGIATVLAIGLFIAASVLPDGLAAYGIGTRTFALFILIALAWFVAGWRTGSRTSFWVAILIVALLGISLSRTALVIALALFPLSQVRLSSVAGWFKMIFSGIGALVLLYAAIWNIEPLRRRFFEGDTSLELFGLRINTEGRMKAWEVIIDSFQEAPWMGKGVGSSQAVIDIYFPWLNHPHNDYLRILHDYGMIGMVFWAAGYIMLLVVTWRAWERSHKRDGSSGRIHLAAFLALIAVALAMITDNVIVYIFVMAPLGILVGASLATMKESPACESST